MTVAEVPRRAGTPLGAVICALLVIVTGVVGVGLSARFAWVRLHPRESQVYGVYVANYQDAKETMALNRDHTFRQDVESELLPQPVHNSGTWSWSQKYGATIELRECMIVADVSGYLRPDFWTNRQLCFYPVEREVAFIFGPLTLFSNEDYPLTKVK